MGKDGGSKGKRPSGKGGGGSEGHVKGGGGKGGKGLGGSDGHKKGGGKGSHDHDRDGKGGHGSGGKGTNGTSGSGKGGGYGGGQPPSGKGGAGKGGFGGGAGKGGFGGGKNGKNGKSGQGGKGGKGGCSGGKGPCRYWEADGHCRLGDNCWFEHAGSGTGGGAGSGGFNGGFNGGFAIRSDDTERFAKQLADASAERMGGQIRANVHLWARCWADAPKFKPMVLTGLVVALARLPYSAVVAPPPVVSCKDALAKYANNSKDGGDGSLKAAEVVFNVVKRLLKFEWEQGRDQEVRQALKEALEEAAGILKMSIKEHRDVSKKLVGYIDDIEMKPWIIKFAAEVQGEDWAAEEDEEWNNNPHWHWRKATVGWLARTDLFCATSLPRLRVPDSSSKGIYDSPEQYADTLERIMVGMTFADGNGAISPRCFAPQCGSVLCPTQGTNTRCKRRNCHHPAVLACMNRYHNEGLCKKCADDFSACLLGPPGKMASTHIYDGQVAHVDVDGKLYISNFACRCPPLHAIHWKSTKRLASPSLVAIVALERRGAALRKEDWIWWGEIVAHAKPQDEHLERARGRLAVSMTSIVGDFDYDRFPEGSYVAVIDCMTFVPEHVPVLHALEEQRKQSVPFDEGALLNLCGDVKADLSNMVGEDEALYNIPQLVQEMIAESRLDPIIQIRRDPDLTARLHTAIHDLVRQATLDRGQLVSFLNSLRNTVHLTQGPPGTGKSYLGVVIVRALIIIRRLWMQKNNSVGTPPILVLSYKNHAIDEFLVDLVNSESDVRRNLIRIGGAGKNADPRLAQYSEKSFQRSDYHVGECRRNLAAVHTLQSTIKQLTARLGLFASYRADMLEDAAKEDAAAQKRRNKAAYDATEVLLASLVRTKLITEALSALEDQESEDDGDDGMTNFLKSVDFLSYDSGDAKSRSTQRMLDSQRLFHQIPKLVDGIAHYFELDDRYTDPGEVLFMFIKGVKPLPMCSFPYGFAPCSSLASTHEVPYCHYHRCHFDVEGRRCGLPLSLGKWYYCKDHACQAPDCQTVRHEGQQYCEYHACFKCVEQGLPAKLAQDDYPRHVCEDHPLCIEAECLELALSKKDYCQKHSNKTSFYGISLTRWRRGVTTAAGDDDDWQSAASGEDERGPKIEAPMPCQGTNKKGKPCKSDAMPGMKFCHAHMPVDKTFARRDEPPAEDKRRPPAPPPPPQELQAGREVPPAEGAAAAAVVPSDEGELSGGAGAGAGDEASPSAAAEATTTVPSPVEEDGSDRGSFFSDADFNQDFADGPRNDNPDEVEEGDHLQHLREVYQVDDGEDSDAPTSEASADEEEDAVANPNECDSGDFGAEGPRRELNSNPATWSWDMSFDEIWDACQDLMTHQQELLHKVLKRLKKQMPIARRALLDAKVKASARVYENKSVIGGTIVGCISRLEAIRSTSPFAILVEEASEVLEPLLYSCLCPSTIKFEMIGDHLQLQPSVMQRFDYVKVNHINISMFERLIRAPAHHRVPSSVLAIQRRMRKDICDLTRDYYRDIVQIEDHEVCGTKVIPGSAAAQSTFKGREVPGVPSHIFVWKHKGDQTKAEVGLSKINKQEADMAVWLAYYLASCGVPRPSIAILTPYKGQLMLMRNILLKDKSKSRLLSWDNTEKDQIRLSTVDRFQGDEADVIIISLVVDAQSRTPFVKLVNRMIVLLSRARLGMYILGNAGYFDSSSQDIKHWTKTFEMLGQPPSATDNTDASLARPFDKPRIGVKFPMCCPAHPESQKEAAGARDLELNFCKTLCDFCLPCSHQCGKLCHWPSKDHETKCKATLASPCAKHPEDITCGHVYANSTTASRRYGGTITDALNGYRCPEKVTLLLPCMHEKEMPCEDEKDIADGSLPWPDCHEISHTPYTYADCRHTLEVTCNKLKLYNASSFHVPPCAELVDYMPGCGHPLQVKCNLKRRYEQNSSDFNCPMKLEIALPRCGHVKKVSCAQEIVLRHWTGTRCEEQDVVREGVAYGPKDHACQEMVTFVHQCGHETKLPCQTAFENAKAVSICRKKVKSTNPHCGHPCEVECHEASRLREMTQNPAVTILDEGSVTPVPSQVSHLKCKQDVTIRRRCGHELKISCHRTAQPLPQCQETVKVKSPLCGHEITVPCCVKEDMCNWQCWEDEARRTLVDCGQLISATPVARSPPSDVVRKCVLACSGEVDVSRPCGHVVTYKCKQLIKILDDGRISSRCNDTVEKPLRCGHLVTVTCQKYQDYESGTGTINCKEKEKRPCWNAEVCGSRDLEVPCGTGADKRICCDAKSDWMCPAGQHTFQLQLCQQGLPSGCPGCSAERLSRAVSDAAEQRPPPTRGLPPGFVRLPSRQVEELNPDNPDVQNFLAVRAIILQTWAGRGLETDPWSQRPFSSTMFPCMFNLDAAKVTSYREGFHPIRTFATKELQNGITVHRYTAENLRGLAAKAKGGSLSLLLGYCFSVNPLFGQSWPNLNAGNKKAKQKRDTLLRCWSRDGNDCIESDETGLKKLLVPGPYPLYATHYVMVFEEDLLQAAEIVDMMPLWQQAPASFTFTAPTGAMVKVRAPPRAAAAAATEPAGAKSARSCLPELRGGPWEALQLQPAWDCTSLADETDISESQQRDLQQKLSFINKDASVFAGKNLLDSIASSKASAAVKLLLSLEVQSKDRDLASGHLDEYLAEVQGKPAHPLVLLALGRLRGSSEALAAFASRYAPAAERLMTAAELERATAGPDAAAPAEPGKKVSAAEPAELWEELKEAQDCRSESMDKLMALTGLRKVKLAAVNLFKSALRLSQMPPDARKANAMALNYCFLGNPGTGKTTVARLFAEILHDSGLREGNSFTEFTAQKLKDDGVDEFRKKAQASLDGVIFIDEAYDLDPVGDKFKGAPIVNEVLTLSENERDKLTIILAGYEDDMNSKLFAYNDGLKSRFTEVIFEDFDEVELTQIWTDMRKARKWEEVDERLTTVVIKRMLKGAGRKGFGNAREVRKRLEQATQRAMAREDFDPRDLVLTFTDAIGDDPRSSVKLQRALAELQSKIGWQKIKKAVQELVDICGKNYERELSGQPPLPVFMNRMFLGNPGTGKTTCAKIYGQILKHLGFLSVGDVVFKTSGDLGGSVVGEAQKKTLDILKGAAGKVLVIDEAYNLDDNLYGKQVLDTLVEKVQGSENDDIAVLLLGYEDQMLQMLRNQNPGLARRFPQDQAFYFEDYDENQLHEILLDSCQRNEVKPSMDFQQKALRKLEMLRRSETNFGNAGAVNNLVKAAVLKASTRIQSGRICLDACDVDMGADDEASGGDPLAPLDKLYRMEGVKAKIQQLSNAFTVAQREGGDLPELGHFVFTGSPGTGKTTVARTVAKILFDLKLITRNHVVETSGLNLTGEYVGQTKKKVEEQLNAAKGGVLFIDEAYELGKGHFGSEACTAIVAAMTDPAYAGLVIVIAGYQNEIGSMLDTNPGLKSRFTHFFEFPDWAPSDCRDLLRKRARDQNYFLDDAALEVIESGFAQLVTLDGWGNARDVDKVWKAALRNRADRVVGAPESQKSLSEADLRGAMDSLVQARRSTTSSGLSRLMRPMPDLPMATQDASGPPQQRQEQSTVKIEELADEEVAPEQGAGPGPGRDPGVSDEVWAELQAAKADAEAREAQQLRELEELRLEEERQAAELQRQLEAEAERIRLELEEHERQEALRRAREAYEAALEAARRKREEAEARRREAQRKAAAIQERLRQLSPCPMGFSWTQCGSGWRCAGGSHFVSNAQLESQFSSYI